MSNPNKNYKIWGVRGSLIGDSIMALPILTFLEKKIPGSFKYWQVARKCSQAVPLFKGHPLIDEIIISDCDEGIGHKDRLIMQQCNMIFNVMPNHPFEQDWPNHRNIYEETWVMAGLDLRDYYEMSEEERRPKLYKWFETEYRKNSIAIWPCAGYGMEGKRHPSRDWYEILCKELSKDYKIIQYGHPNDFKIENAYADMRGESFFDQIKHSLGCEFAITTDSGSGLALGAYGMKQVSLLTNHFPGHVRNLEAFGPDNLNNKNFVGIGNPNSILQDEVIQYVKSII